MATLEDLSFNGETDLDAIRAEGMREQGFGACHVVFADCTGLADRVFKRKILERCCCQNSPLYARYELIRKRS